MKLDHVVMASQEGHGHEASWEAVGLLGVRLRFRFHVDTKMEEVRKKAWNQRDLHVWKQNSNDF